MSGARLVSAGCALALLSGLSPLAARAQDDPFGAPAPDPFGAPAPDPFAADVAPVVTRTGPPSMAAFDPDAVRANARPGLWLGPVELHGRANLTLSSTGPRRTRVEHLRGTQLSLSSADLYAQWFPTRWFGLMGEVELAYDLEGDGRELEVEPELLLAEVRPLGDDRLRLRLGYFPVPFGIERRYYAPPRNELATRPAPFRTVFPGTYSDWGAAVWARQPLPLWGGEVEAEVALTRGLEGPLGRDARPGPFDRDGNGEPQLTGRVGWTVFDLHPASDALAGLVGVPLRLSLGASLLLGHHDRRARSRVRLVGLDAGLTVGELTARAEVIAGEVEDGAPGRTVRCEGLYAQLVWRRRFERPWLEEGFVALRYDLADPDTRVRDARDARRWHLGLGWVPVDGVLVKLGLELSRERRGDWQETVFLELGYSF